MRTSDRGFKQGETITTSRGETVRVSESSAAMAPHIWLWVEVPKDSTYNNDEEVKAHAHLTLEEAESLRDQLDHLINNHYQNS